MTPARGNGASETDRRCLLLANGDVRSASAPQPARYTDRTYEGHPEEVAQSFQSRIEQAMVGYTLSSAR